MAARKRAYDDGDEGSKLSILIADGVRLTANKHLVIVASSCAAGLPSDAAEWDLSQLQVEGQPVSRDMVIAWLHTVCWALLGEAYPAEPQLDPPLGSTAAGLVQLLAFADAVGSNLRIMEACLQYLYELHIAVQAGEQRLELRADEAHFWDPASPLQLQKLQPNLEAIRLATLPSEAKAQVIQQFAQQVEVLLFLAHKLQLQDLIDAMDTCVQRNSILDTSLTSARDKETLDSVLSGRVLEAAAGPGESAQQDYINRVLTECGTFAPSAGYRRLLRPLSLSVTQQQPVRFSAELLDDLLAPGSRGKQVPVTLDLFGASQIRIGGTLLPVQLLFG